MACLNCKKESNNICAYAAAYGHLECLIWARKNGYPWDEYTCSDAAKYGHLDCLMWARKNGCPWDEGTCKWATWQGHLDCLIWARKNKCPWNKWVCAYAANYGHLECLIWARCSQNANTQQCPWDEDTCICWAAFNGHLDCLIWARRNRCPWNGKTCYYANVNGYKNILKWIHKNSSPCQCVENIVYEEWDGWKEGEEEDCAICLERLDESTVKFVKCVHHYHKECMDMMFKTREKKGCSICERGK